MRLEPDVKEPCDHNRLSRLRGTGLRVATGLSVVALWCAIPTLSSGCLVTQDIEFQEQEDTPPTFVFRPRSVPPIGETLTIDTDELSNQNITNLTFTAQVRDDNLQQPLQTQIRLRTLESPSFIERAIIDRDGNEIPGTGAPVRDFEFSLSTTELKDLHCHQLELAVSGKFLDLTGEDRVFAFPARGGDVAIATWWLWEISPGTPVNLATCPTNMFP